VTYLNRFRLDGRVAFVTGGAQGIGLACAEALAEAGATVVIGDRDERLLAEGANTLSEKGYKVEAELLDVTDSARAAEVANAIGLVNVIFDDETFDTVAIDSYQTMVKQDIELVVSSDSDVMHVINEQYGFRASVSQAAKPNANFWTPLSL